MQRFSRPKRFGHQNRFSVFRPERISNLRTSAQRDAFIGVAHFPISFGFRYSGLDFSTGTGFTPFPYGPFSPYLCKAMKKITVLLVDDHTVVREGLRALLAQEEDIEVVGEAADGRRAMALCKQLSPEVVVMDVAMPLLNGMDATRQILKNCQGTAVLVLSSYTDEECVKHLLKAGAAGYLTKQTAADYLPRAIRDVRRGHKFFSPEIAKQLQQRERPINDHYDGKPELTSRELEVLQLIAER